MNTELVLHISDLRVILSDNKLLPTTTKTNLMCRTVIGPDYVHSTRQCVGDERVTAAKKLLCTKLKAKLVISVTHGTA